MVKSFMQIKIDEKVIAEIIGADLEPIDGAVADTKSDQTYANLDNDRGLPPPDGTTINKQASKEKDFFQRYMYGGNGSIRFSTYTESVDVKEDVVTTNRREADLISKSEPNLSDVSNLFDEQILAQNVKTLVDQIKKTAKRKNDEDIKNINYIILYYLLNNLNISNLSNQEKQKLINAIK